MSDNDQDRELWESALREYARGMTAPEFASFTAQVRPPDDDDPLAPRDPAARAREQHWRNKTQQLLNVPHDHNGSRIPSGLSRIDLPQPDEPPAPEGFKQNRAQDYAGGEPPRPATIAESFRMKLEQHRNG